MVQYDYSKFIRGEDFIRTSSFSTPTRQTIIAEVTPSSFPDPSEVSVQTGQAGADTQSRLEEELRENILDEYNL